jgi:ribosomal protein S18 acetylase RimI-like enzyme
MLKIRHYAESDHDAVWHLHNAALADTGAHVGNGPWDDDLHNIIDEYINPGGEFLVGEGENGSILAMGALRAKSADEAEIKRMRVMPKFQGRGYGKQLLSQLEHRAGELGFRRMVLDTTTIQVTAIALYSNHGYVETGRGVMAGMDVVFMSKDLGPVA